MRTILITGASQGIGAEIAKTFAKNGDRVVINYNSSEDKAKLVAEEVSNLGGTPLLVKADVSKFNDAKKLISTTISTFGNIDVLVCNAGVCDYGLVCDLNEETINKVVSTNLTGTINVCKFASENMLQNQNGKIITISSMFGITGGSNEALYSATKAGIIGFSKALAKELGPNNINVNVVAPGTIESTQMTSHLSQETLNALASETALNRNGQVQDVANVVEFLASDKASYITGQVISVDGGYII